MKKSTGAFPFIFCFVFSILTIAPANGTTYLVYPDGTGDYVTIQDAIDAALGGDSILLGSGTFAGPRNKNLDTQGKAIVLSSISGAENTVIDCEDAGRAFYIHSGEGHSTVIHGVTVTNGYANALGDKGGAIHCDNSSPSISECIFESNYADESGGAIYLNQSNARMVRNRFLRNNCWLYCDRTSSARRDETAAANVWLSPDGSGIFCVDSDVTIIDNYFLLNQIINDGRGSGVGAINCTLTIVGNEFDMNGTIHDDWGASIYADTCHVQILGNHFHENAGWSSAGLAVMRCTGAVRANWLDNNGGYINGGGIVSYGSDASIDFNLLTDNGAGGIEIANSTDLVNRNIITRTRHADMWIGVGIEVSNSPGAIITNNVLYENLGWAGCDGTELTNRGAMPTIESNIFVNSNPEPMVICNALYQRSADIDTVHVIYNYYYGNMMSWLNGCILGPFVDPMFCDPAADNWFLQPGSPCVIDTLIPGGGAGRNDLYQYGFIGALPVGCATSDVLWATVPPDDNVNNLAPGAVYNLSGFTVTNISDQEGPVYYDLQFGGEAIPDDRGNPFAFTGVSPVLRPGETFMPPQTALIVPDAENQSICTVTYLVAYAPALNMPDTFVTTIIFDTSTPVVMQSFAGSWSGQGVLLEWQTAPTNEVSEWEIYRSSARGTFSPITVVPLPANTRSYLDGAVEPGASYTYRLVATTAAGLEIACEIEIKTPFVGLALFQNMPNPFNPITAISFSLPDRMRVTLTIFDVEGRRVVTLVDGLESAGSHTVEWNGRDHRGSPQSSGVYFYRLLAGKRALTRKMVLMR